MFIPIQWITCNAGKINETMKSKNQPERPSASFNKIAKDRLNKTGITVPEMNTLNETRRVYHELVVTQMELTMQNDELLRTQKELGESQARYFALYDHAPVGYLTLDETGKIIETNSTAVGMLGLSKKSIVNELFSIFIPADDLIVFNKYFKNRFESNASQVYALRLMRSRGTPFWVRVEGNNVPDKEGRPNYEIMIFDITHQKLSEQMLQDSEEKYRNLVANQNDLIVKVDPDNRFIFVSPSYCRLFGTTESQLIGKAFMPLVHEDDKEKIRTAMPDLYRSPFTCYYEHRVMTMKGWRWISWSEKAVLNERTEITAIIGVGRDITDQKEAEDALKISEERLRQIIEQSREVVWDIDVTGLYTYVSPLSKSVYGYSPGELVGKLHFWELHPEEYQKEFKLHADSVFEKQETMRDFINPILTPEGKTIWVSTNGIPLIDKEGKLIGYRGSDSDITERLRIEKELLLAKEKAEASDQLKTAFMNNISHEVRTPLNGILGFGNLLAQPDTTNEEKELFSSLLKTSSERLLRTMNDYMDISLITSGNLQASFKEMNLREFLGEIRKKTLPLCAIKKLDFNVSFPNTDEKIMLRTDHELLEKIISHLLDNAIKYTHEGSVTLGYDIKANHIEFFIKDTGIGINEEAITRILKPFMQEELSNVRRFEGNGLGLSIADGLVKILGGKIHLESVPGVGTTVMFTHPYEAMTSGSEEIIRPVDSQQGHDLPVILVADDESVNNVYLKVILRENASEIYFASNGKEAVDLCLEHPEISLVLMDLKMPVMDGLTATRLIREFRHEVPIIAFTAYAMSGDEHRAMEAGCNDYLAKPVLKEELLKMIEKHLPKN